MWIASKLLYKARDSSVFALFHNASCPPKIEQSCIAPGLTADNDPPNPIVPSSAQATRAVAAVEVIARAILRILVAARRAHPSAVAVLGEPIFE